MACVRLANVLAAAPELHAAEVNADDDGAASESSGVNSAPLVPPAFPLPAPPMTPLALAPMAPLLDRKFTSMFCKLRFM